MNRYAVLGFSTVIAAIASAGSATAQTKEISPAASLSDVAKLLGSIDAMNEIIPAKVRFGTYKMFPDMIEEDNAKCDALWEVLNRAARVPLHPDVQEYARSGRQELLEKGGACTPAI